MLKFILGSTIIEIREDVLERLLDYRQKELETPESGGILQGKRLKNGGIIITDLTEPQPNDVQKRSFFKKDKDIHQQLSDKMWRESRGTCVSLGEWHTHPESDPTPSPLDKRGWNKNVRKQSDKNVYLFIIVGISELRLWGKSKGSKLECAQKYEGVKV